MSADSAEEDFNSSLPPLWKFVSVEHKISGGGNVRFTCNYCGKSFPGSFVRVKSHLLKIGGTGIAKCTRVSSNDLVITQREQREFETRAAKVLPKEVPLPPSNSRTNSFSSSASTGTSMGTRLQARQDLDYEIARMFYSSGLAFSLAKNPYYIRSYTRAVNSKHLAGYVPPGLLEPLKTAWKGKGVSIVSDGWTDAQRRSLISFMAASEGGTMFLQAVNCEGEYKDKYFICNLLKEVILSVGPQNVVQVITDNAPNTQANAETYEECSWVTEVTGDVMAIENFIVNHPMRLSMFNANSQLKLFSLAETRFASSIIMLKRLKLIKQGLFNMLVSPNWANYREDNVQKSAFVKEKILNDLWWDKIDYIIALMEPIYEMLRKADTDKPCLHLVYDWWD
ncbi:hypothetical protein CTI12_AA570960 [Artemisia annua]|uniref:DUF659 domain-containing protein n=1 Tax=Artemisia annua TaxID=35608 RepID=A0A2U1KS77_ARTAN|nr:hypothetical protein CTI12_AA570960 [Artemisia annua]